ncbi:MAG: hypothetical protein NT128_00880 [Proteobacteria bacterium]|nr:hypothetical protein [Pseudomonadota bacterium]
MLKIFYLVPSILVAGKLIASHPQYPPINDDLSLGNPTVRIAGATTQQPELTTGITKVKYPLQNDQAVVLNPVDDSLGVAKPLPIVVIPPANIDGLGVKLVPPEEKPKYNGLSNVPPTIPSDPPKVSKSSYTFWPYVALGVGAVGLFVVILRSGIFSAARKK